LKMKRTWLHSITGVHDKGIEIRLFSEHKEKIKATKNYFGS
jgi:hypothetical protein